ncbi:MAG: hypothetical protein AAF959_10030 [Cyanobacteria bacterium P01_D01_bin.56]
MGAAAGVTAAWLVDNPDLIAAEIVEQDHMVNLQELMITQGLRLRW